MQYPRIDSDHIQQIKKTDDAVSMLVQQRCTTVWKDFCLKKGANGFLRWNFTIFRYCTAIMWMLEINDSHSKIIRTELGILSKLCRNSYIFRGVFSPKILFFINFYFCSPNLSYTGTLYQLTNNRKWKSSTVQNKNHSNLNCKRNDTNHGISKLTNHGSKIKIKVLIFIPFFLFRS